MVATALDPAELHDALGVVAQVVADHSVALDRLELGPSDDPDGSDGSDPWERSGRRGAGTDLALTLSGAVDAAAAPTAFGPLVDALVSGARSAAGRPAGRHLVVVLEGLADSLRNADRFDAERFALGLELAAERLAPGDDGAHAGSFPAVVARAADAALGAVDEGASLADAVIGAADDGLAELEDGPRSNPALVERGVVDAGAAGFLLVLDALAAVLTGEPLPEPPRDPVVTPGTDFSAGGPHYRVTCQVEPNEGCGLESANWLESLWYELGELERFERGSDRWEVALSTVDPGAAVEAIFEVGRPRGLRIAALDRTRASS